MGMAILVNLGAGMDLARGERFEGVKKRCSSFCKSSSSSIGDLNTSKAKLRGAKYQREKTKTRWFS